MANFMDQYLDYLKNRVSVNCPACDTSIYGMPNDIDSGLRKHMEYCEKYQQRTDNE